MPQLLLRLHPDKNVGRESTDAIQRVQGAFAAIKAQCSASEMHDTHQRHMGGGMNAHGVNRWASYAEEGGSAATVAAKAESVAGAAVAAAAAAAAAQWQVGVPSGGLTRGPAPNPKPPATSPQVGEKGRQA